MTRTLPPFALALTLLTAASLSAQGLSNQPPNAEPGKCYAKAALPATAVQADITYATYHRYVGQAPWKLVARRHVFRYGAAGDVLADTTVMEPRKLRKVPADAVETYELVTYQEGGEGAGEIVWREIACVQDYTPDFVYAVVNQLANEGFYAGEATQDRLDARARLALRDFQVARGLAVGQLDRETLDALGVAWPGRE